MSGTCSAHMQLAPVPRHHPAATDGRSRSSRSTMNPTCLYSSANATCGPPRSSMKLTSGRQRPPTTGETAAPAREVLDHILSAAGRSPPSRTIVHISSAVAASTLLLLLLALHQGLFYLLRIILWNRPLSLPLPFSQLPPPCAPNGASSRSAHAATAPTFARPLFTTTAIAIPRVCAHRQPGLQVLLSGTV